MPRRIRTQQQTADLFQAAKTRLLGPIAARAQQPERMRRVVVLSGTAETDLEIQARNAAFVQTLPQLGWTDGRNVRIDCHWISSDRRRDRPMIADLEGPSFISRTVAHRRVDGRCS